MTSNTQRLKPFVALTVAAMLSAASAAAPAATVVAQAEPAKPAGTTVVPARPPGPPSPGTLKAGPKLPRNRKSGIKGMGAGAPGVGGLPAGAAVQPVPTTPGGATTTPAAGTTTPGTTGAGEAPAEFNSCHKFPANKRIVKLNMKPETELGDLISWISSITCKQFLLPGTIPANSKKVTVIAPQLITPEEAYKLFLAALDSVGLTVQESGKFFRIIETVKARGNAPLTGPDGEMLPGDRYITRMVRVEHADTNEMSQVLTRLKSEQGDIIAYPPQGALIITDVSSAVDRMLKVLDELDQPSLGEKVWIVRMKNIAATEMSQKLAEIFKVEQLGGRRGAAAAAPAAAAPGTKKPGGADLAMEMTISKMIPDERSNQLIIIASDRAYARVLTLIRKLDVPIEGGDGRIHVYYCENANCDELGQTLGAVTGVSVSGGGAARTRRGAAGAAPAAPTAAPGAGGGQLPLLFDGDMRVSFDRPTNSLIILSSLKDYQVLRRVIEKLDSPRKQVFVEAMVLEVSLDKTRTLGASFHGADNEIPFLGKKGLFLGGLDASKTLFPANALAGGDTLLGLAAGVIGPVVPGSGTALGATTTGATDIPAFGVLVRALQSNNDVNVLSTPHLLIMNNEDGEISVGQNLPFQGASFGGGAAAGAGGLLGGLAGIATPVQRTDVALKMKLTPHVNEHDMIRLEVDQEIQDILSANFNNLGPATSKRSAKTTVVARDQQTIVIGGLMSDRNVEKITKIPLLGDIPILGFFFRNTTKTVQKTNILIALTPYVITDQSDLRRVLEKKLKERREFVERFGKQEVVNPEASIDYRRKRGMLEEINRTARDVEKEEDEMQRQLEIDAVEEASQLEPPSAPAPARSGNGGGGTGPDGPGMMGPPPSTFPSSPLPPSSGPGPRAPTPSQSSLPSGAGPKP